MASTLLSAPALRAYIAVDRAAKQEATPNNPFYFNDSQVVLKASPITWLLPSLLRTHLSKGGTKDI